MTTDNDGTSKDDTEQATCNYCGKQFEPTAGGKYCSLECVGKSNRKRVEKKCEHCGDSFESKPSADRKYCSEPCYRKGRRNRVTKECEECGDSFTVRKSAEEQIYCSRECKYESGRVELTCEECGDQFIVWKSKSDQEYCSKKCSYQARVDRVTVECDYCGADVEKWPSHAEGVDTHYCSMACQKGETEFHDCDHCGEEVRVAPSEQHLDHHFCDIECYSEFFKTRQEVPCAECGNLVEKHEYRIEEYDNVFCSTDCSNEFKRTGEEYECENCGDTVYRTPSSVGERVFCSDECYQELNVGENHHSWSKIAVRCWWCEDDILKKPTRVERTKRHFCSKRCMGRWRSWNNMHPQDQEPDRDVPKWLWDERIKSASQPPNVKELEKRVARYTRSDT